MPDDHKTALDVVRNELNYRREKQWKIFSWIATILVTIISGLVALAGKGEWKIASWQKAIMSVAVVVITIYACTWIHENIRFEKLAHKKIVADLKDNTILADPGKFTMVQSSFLCSQRSQRFGLLHEPKIEVFGRQPDDEAEHRHALAERVSKLERSL